MIGLRSVAAFAVVLAGCDSGASPEVSGAGSTLQSSGHDQNPYGIAYPEAPPGGYGHAARSGATAGSVIENFKFRGFVDGVVPANGQPGVVSLADYFDPCGKTYRVIRLSAAAVWCGACGAETDAYVAAKADLAARGVVVLQFLFEGPAMGAPATPSMLAGWIGEHGSNFTELLDPEPRRSRPRRLFPGERHPLEHGHRRADDGDPDLDGGLRRIGRRRAGHGAVGRRVAPALPGGSEVPVMAPVNMIPTLVTPAGNGDARAAA